MASSHRKQALIGLPVMALLALAAVAALMLSSASSSSAQAQHAIDHYMCYPITAVPAKPSNVTVTLKDQFEQSVVPVGTAKSLCAPAIKNDQGTLINPNDHLKCYAIKENPPFPGKDVIVDDQFGTAHVHVGTAVSLCAPTAKSLTGFPPPTEFTLDHYKCYNAKQTSPAFRPTPVSISDQFGFQRLVLTTPTQLCTPVSKNGAPIHDTTDHLVGYPADIRAFTRNQFGTETVRGHTGRMLYVPAFKTIPGTTRRR